MRSLTLSLIATALASSCVDGGALTGPGLDPAAAGAAGSDDPAASITVTLTVEDAQLTADGFSRTTVIATTNPPVDGAVVQFTTTAGVLAADAAMLVNGDARTEIIAPPATLLGAQPSLTADLAATLQTSAFGTAVASTTLVFVRAQSSPTADPELLMEASTTSALADGATVVELDVLGLGAPAGTVVSLTTTTPGITFTPAIITLDAQSAGSASFRAPSEAGTVVVQAAMANAAPVTVSVAFTALDAAPDITGTYATISWAHVEITGGVVEPSPQRVAAPALLLAKIERKADGTLHMVSKMCGIEFPDVNLALGMGCSATSPKFEAAYLAGMEPSDDPIVVEGAPGAWTLRIPASGLNLPTVFGADLVNPNDPLPENEGDARCTDPDNDGHPGITLAIDGQDDKYVVMRSATTKFDGEILPDGSITGEMEGTSESKILNSDWLIETFSPGMRGLPSTFSMFRVDGAQGSDDLANNDLLPGITCADLVAEEAELIGRSESPEPPVCNAN